jgi:hypothetical protein
MPNEVVGMITSSTTAAASARAIHVEEQNSTASTPSARPNGGRRAPLTLTALVTETTVDLPAGGRTLGCSEQKAVSLHLELSQS